MGTKTIILRPLDDTPTAHTGYLVDNFEGSRFGYALCLSCGSDGFPVYAGDRAGGKVMHCRDCSRSLDDLETPA